VKTVCAGLQFTVNCIKSCRRATGVFWPNSYSVGVSVFNFLQLSIQFTSLRRMDALHRESYPSFLCIPVKKSTHPLENVILFEICNNLKSILFVEFEKGVRS